MAIYQPLKPPPGKCITSLLTLPPRAIYSETEVPQENSKKKIVFHAITATPPRDDPGVYTSPPDLD